MTVSAFGAAKRICETSGWSVSNLELQKILFIAHMIFLGRNLQPLIYGSFEAWDYGPVQPELYHRVKAFGSDPVGNVFRSIAPVSGSEASFIDEACDRLLQLRPGQLVAITHWEHGALAKHYRPGCRHCVIDNKDILEEYRMRMSD